MRTHRPSPSEGHLLWAQVVVGRWSQAQGIRLQRSGAPGCLCHPWLQGCCPGTVPAALRPAGPLGGKESHQGLTIGSGPDTCAGYNSASSLRGHYDPRAAPQPHSVRPGTPPGLHPPGIPFCLSVRPSQSICPVSAPWRTWTTSVQNTLGQSGEGGRPLTQREQVTGRNSIHRTP